MANFVVIGGSKGIGKALTQSLVADQHQVFFTARSQVEIEGASFLELDITQEITNQFNGLPDVRHHPRIECEVMQGSDSTRKRLRRFEEVPEVSG